MSTSRYFNTIVAAVTALAVALTALLLCFSENKEVAVAMSSSLEMPYEDLFNQFEVMEVDIAIASADWEELLENPLSEEYKPCDVTVNGTLYANVAVRTKGNTSLSQVASTDSDRYSFKIEFDHYDKNQSLNGLDKLVLNNIFCDATYVKEYIAYDIFRYMGVQTPYYAFASITINGESFGCYLALEAMEDSFLQRVYHGSGQLYKPESSRAGGGMGQGGKPGMGEQPELGEQPEMGERPEMGGQPGMGERPELGERPNMGEQPEPGERPRMGEQPELGERPETSLPSGQGDGGMPEGKQFPGGEAPFPDRGQASEEAQVPGDGAFSFEGGRKGDFGMDSSGGGSDLVYTDDELDSYSDIFDNASFHPTDEDKRRVIAALEKLNKGEELETYIDVDACLRYFAAQTFIVNMDSYYSMLKHNYYLYENNGQLTILPWDLNLAFGGFQNAGATEAVNSAIDTPMGGSLEESRPLFGRLMEVAEYQERYHQYLGEIVEGYVNSGQFTTTLSKIQNLIAPYVAEDATAFYSYSEFQEAVQTLKIFVLLRGESVRKQLAGEIPSVNSERTQDAVLVDASAINLSTMGMQGGDGAGGKGSMDGRMFGGGKRQ